MGSRSIKICDRCKGEWENTIGSEQEVQKVRLFVPISRRLHGTTEREQDLCQACRERLSNILKDFMANT